MEKEKMSEFNAYVRALIESGRMEGKEAGIAKRMLDNGYESLSPKQKIVFDKAINNNTIDKCSRCGCDIPLSEMLEALGNGGLCNYCQHILEEFKND